VNNFADRLAAAVTRKKSAVCVGLDPRLEMLPPNLSILEYCAKVIEAVAPYAAAVKPQVAFFEEHWDGGMDAFRRVCKIAHDAGLLVVADVKRGDIADTAEAYARAFLEKLDADAITVNPYMGSDSLKPFIQRCANLGKGLFILAKTSNPSSGDFQDVMVEGEPMYVRVARRVQEWGRPLKGESGYSSLGIVVGATHRDQAENLRRTCPDLWFLVPGYGAQGATAQDVKVCFDGRGQGAIVNASRSIIYAYRNDAYRSKYNEGEWYKAVADAARAMREELGRAVPGLG
jgi:orotidine-5'-phosphate decarboxylase